MTDFEKDEILKQAKSFLHKGNLYKLAIALNTVQKAEIRLLTTEEYVKLYETAKNVEGCSPKSMKYYLYVLNRFFGKVNTPVVEITTDHIRKFLDEYMEINSVSKVSLDNIRRILSSFFSWLEEENYISKNPVKRIHKIKAIKTVKQAYTDENLEILKDNCTCLRDKVIVELLSSTGMRVGELVTLNIENVDFERKECLVLGKGGKQRKVYFDSKTKIHLQKYLSTRCDKTQSLFVSLLSPYNKLQISGVEIMLRKLGIRAKVNNVHPHRFRRTLGTKAIDKGMPVEQVQILLGHTKIDTTMHYAMVDQSNVKASYRKFID